MSRENPYATQWRQFRASTPAHELAVLHDSGPYRHLRMSKPGTGIWSWNVITWPGYLTIAGDVGGGFTFVREADMLAFMDTRSYGDYYGDGSPHLQADYWAEKLTPACREAAWSYNPEMVLSHIRDNLTERGIGGAEQAEIIEEALAVSEAEHELRDWLYTAREFSGYDTWEWTFRSLDHHYVLACYAIAATVRAYYAIGGVA